ncbi:MAG: CARDB domain-containing protein [Candidatus Thermoplasmatota archaeon]
MRKICILFVLSIILPFLPLGSYGKSPQETDVPTLYIGEKWCYHRESYIVRPSGSYINETDEVVTTVKEVRTVNLNGTDYDAYVIEMKGTVVGEGVIVEEDENNPLGAPIPYTEEGKMDGYLWVNREDNSLIYSYTEFTGKATLKGWGNPSGDMYGVTTLTLEPPEEDYDFPIKISETWNVHSIMKAVGTLKIKILGLFSYDNTETGTAIMDMDSKAVSYTKITVKAGTFDAYYIYSKGTAQGSSPDGTIEVWWVEGVKNYARYLMHNISMGEFGTVVYSDSYLTSYSLLNSPVYLSASLEPNSAPPKGYTKVKGYTASNANINIETPVNKNSWNAKADGNGKFELTITAPSEKDSTKTTYDIGSHGVIVTVNDGTKISYIIKTITLKSMPDLSLSSLTVSTPNLNFPTEIKAKVKNIGNLEARDISVYFYEGSSKLGEIKIPYLDGGMETEIKFNWTPTISGNITIIAKIDSIAGEEYYDNNMLQTTVYVNSPPTVSLVSPKDKTSVSSDVTLEWKGEDRDGDELSYEVFYSLSIDDVLTPSISLFSLITDTKYIIQASALIDDTTYYWTVIPYDGKIFGITKTVWSFKTKFNDKPEIEYVNVLPDKVENDGRARVKFIANVFDKDGRDDIENVLMDISALGLNSQKLFDDGTNGDELANDWNFTYETVIERSIAPGVKNLILKVRDKSGEEDVREIFFEVLKSNSPPKIISAKADPEKIFNDGKTKLRIDVEVEDMDGLDDIASVMIDLKELGGTKEEMTTDGNGIYTIQTTVGKSVEPGLKKIKIDVSDKDGATSSYEIEIEVLKVNKQPKIKSFSVEPKTALNDGTSKVLFKLEAEDDGNVEVLIDLTQIEMGKKKMILEDGIYIFEVVIGKNVQPGEKKISVTVIDDFGLKAEEKVLLQVNKYTSNLPVDENEQEKKEEAKKSPGFEFVLLLICILLIMRKKNG